MLRPTIVPGLQLYGDGNDVSGTYEDDGNHAGHRLEPCPFCGSTRVELANTHTPSYWIECRKCSAQAHGNMPSGAGGQIATDRDALRFHLRAIRSAVRAWNRRSIEHDRSHDSAPRAPVADGARADERG